MFEILQQWPWWIFCSILTLGAVMYGIVMRFVPDDVDGSSFGIGFTAVSSLILLSLCVIYALSGGQFEISMVGAIAAVIMGLGLVIVDLGMIEMYRAGAPVSLGMPMVRAGLALVTAIMGFLFFAEVFTVLKLLGILCVCAGIFLLGQKKTS